jgi:hypothetical protein
MKTMMKSGHLIHNQIIFVHYLNVMKKNMIMLIIIMIVVMVIMNMINYLTLLMEIKVLAMALLIMIF